jgi:hypothetical protein
MDLREKDSNRLSRAGRIEGCETIENPWAGSLESVRVNVAPKEGNTHEMEEKFSALTLR